MKKATVILAIESSCDDTSSAVIVDGILRSNVIASQKVHEEYGGVVPELASRAHQQNILPVVDTALKRAGVTKDDISAIAFTRGPGLLGSLLLQGHVLAHFVEDGTGLNHPTFPFLCLLVSGGNSQIVRVNAYNDMEIIGQTIDDAAGEAFDKCAKVLGLPYPGGPWIDKLAKLGDPNKYPFAKPNIAGYDYSFSGLKTSFLYTLRDMLKAHNVETIDRLAECVPNLREDMCASLQATVVDIPPFSFTTDNAAMVCQAGYFKYLDHDFCAIDAVPFAKTTI